jgi:23S rRNA pseudouridine1911/1915/1917 synthase
MRVHDVFTFEITDDLAGIRLDKALSHCPRIESRSQASRLLAWELVLIDGQVAKASRLTTVGDVYAIHFPEKEIKDLLPMALDLDIPYEDDDIIVVNKPPGLVVHPAAGHNNDTLVNALAYHQKKLSSGSEDYRPGLVHRLDKDTSGLLVLAKNDHAHRKLAEQFKARTVRRVYWAICHGRVTPSTGRIESALQRQPNNRLRFRSEALQPGQPHSGKWAITDYRSLDFNSKKNLSLVELKLQTGRTHQIRVHLSERENPICGDAIYLTSKFKALESKLEPPISRLLLHARTLGFFHPTKNIEVDFEAIGHEFGFDPAVWGLNVGT